MSEKELLECQGKNKRVADVIRNSPQEGPTNKPLKKRHRPEISSLPSLHIPKMSQPSSSKDAGVDETWTSFFTEINGGGDGDDTLICVMARSSSSSSVKQQTSTGGGVVPAGEVDELNGFMSRSTWSAHGVLVCRAGASPYWVCPLVSFVLPFDEGFGRGQRPRPFYALSLELWWKGGFDFAVEFTFLHCFSGTSMADIEELIESHRLVDTITDEKFAWVAPEPRGAASSIVQWDPSVHSIVEDRGEGDLENWEVHVPEEGKRVCLEFSVGGFAMYEFAFKDLKFRLPFSDFVVGVFDRLRLAPSQLHLNSLAFIRTFELLCNYLDVEPTLPLFFRIFKIQRQTVRGRQGWVSLKHHQTKIFRMFVDSVRGFKERHFALPTDAYLVMDVLLSPAERAGFEKLRAYVAGFQPVKFMTKAGMPANDAFGNPRVEPRFVNTKSLLECTSRDASKSLLDKMADFADELVKIVADKKRVTKKKPARSAVSNVILSASSTPASSSSPVGAKGSPSVVKPPPAKRQRDDFVVDLESIEETKGFMFPPLFGMPGYLAQHPATILRSEKDAIMKYSSEELGVQLAKDFTATLRLAETAMVIELGNTVTDLKGKQKNYANLAADLRKSEKEVAELKITCFAEKKGREKVEDELQSLRQMMAPSEDEPEHVQSLATRAELVGEIWAQMGNVFDSAKVIVLSSGVSHGVGHGFLLELHICLGFIQDLIPGGRFFDGNHLFELGSIAEVLPHGVLLHVISDIDLHGLLVESLDVIPGGNGSLGQASVPSHGTFDQCGRKNLALDASLYCLVIEDSINVLDVYVGVSEPVILPQLGPVSGLEYLLDEESSLVGIGSRLLDYPESCLRAGSLSSEEEIGVCSKRATALPLLFARATAFSRRGVRFLFWTCGYDCTRSRTDLLWLVPARRAGGDSERLVLRVGEEGLIHSKICRWPSSSARIRAFCSLTVRMVSCKALRLFPLFSLGEELHRIVIIGIERGFSSVSVIGFRNGLIGVVNRHEDGIAGVQGERRNDVNVVGIVVVMARSPLSSSAKQQTSTGGGVVPAGAPMPKSENEQLLSCLSGSTILGGLDKLNGFMSRSTWSAYGVLVCWAGASPYWACPVIRAGVNLGQFLGPVQNKFHEKVKELGLERELQNNMADCIRMTFLLCVIGRMFVDIENENKAFVGEITELKKLTTSLKDERNKLKKTLEKCHKVTVDKLKAEIEELKGEISLQYNAGYDNAVKQVLHFASRLKP
ncbi:hypothetical protein TSUD_160730 [Trifolium subterraneum]|uniref:Transposase (putative) gypsy type domain-containing protein n=1 Tax=Trifolium subterraneum TaxID=3900 RepID=A0A2Z6MDR6_TRISU|nr:hypothetical protein TSUD_160730 [Trifolium subterraneum]